MKSKVYLTVISLVLLAGCGAHTPVSPDLDPTPVEIVVKVPYSCGQPPGVSMVLMRDIYWDFTSFPDYAALTVDDYKLLGLNTSDWIAASRELKAQRDFYRDCIKRSQEEIHDENLDAGLVPSVPAN